MFETQQAALTYTQRFLRENYGSSVNEVRPLGAGGWSQAYSYELDGLRHVIRWSKVADNFERDAFAARFTRDGLPVPNITATGQTESLFYAISPFVAGSFLEALSPQELDQTVPAILTMFRALRSVDLSQAEGFGFWNGEGVANHTSWKAFLLDDKNDSAGSLIHGWKAKLETSTMGLRAYDQLRKILESLVEYCPEERSLVHSDLLNRNVLTAEGSITAVLDWGSSFYGDALYDVAWVTFCVLWFAQFEEIGLVRRLQEDFKTDPHTSSVNFDARLLCYLVDIGIGSIAYNAYIGNWSVAEEVADYTLSLARHRVAHVVPGYRCRE